MEASNLNANAIESIVGRPGSSFEFSSAVALWPQYGKSNRYAPFTEKWIQYWAKVARSKNKITGKKLFPGASERYEKFREKNGLTSLKALADKGANPDLVLYLMITYLWNDQVPLRDHKHPTVQFYSKLREAIRVVKNGFSVSSAWLRITSALLPNLALQIYKPSLPSDTAIQEALSALEKFAGSMIDLPDSRQRKPHPAKDNVNRIIFALDEYLLRKTKGHQWEFFWDLLVSAGAIKGGGVLSAKDRQLKPHIKAFEKDHPAEAGYIRSLVTYLHN